MIKFFKKKNKKQPDQQPDQQQGQQQDQQQDQPVNQPLDDQTATEDTVKGDGNQAPDSTTEPAQDPAAQAEQPVIEVPPELLAQGVEPHQYQLSQQLEKTNENLGKKVKQLFSIKKQIDEDLFEELETTLLMADVGATATMDVLEKVRKSLKRRNLSDSDAVFAALSEQGVEVTSMRNKANRLEELFVSLLAKS